MKADPEAIRTFEHAGWQRAAPAYETSFATATRQFIAPLLEIAGLQPGQTLLDVACGPGFVTAAAADQGGIVRGLDFSTAMLAVARSCHPGLNFDHGDAEVLPYPDASFDAVVSNFGIHHVPQPILALHEAYRVLRRGGTLAFTVWAAPAENIAWKLVFDAIRMHGDLAASKAPAPGGGFSTPADCAEVLAQAGFADIQTRSLAGIWHQPDGETLLDALQAGTARMAALIESQSRHSRPAIIAEIDRQASEYRDGLGLAIPLAAFVAAGRKA